MTIWNSTLLINPLNTWYCCDNIYIAIRYDSLTTTTTTINFNNNASTTCIVASVSDKNNDIAQNNLA